MKKVMLFCAASMLLWQCSKEDELGKVPEAPKQENTVKSKTGGYSYLEDFPPPEDPEAAVMDFVEAYNNSNLESMALDEAVWHLEAGVNFENRHDVYTFEAFDVDTMEITIDVVDETIISGTELESAFEKVLLSVNEPSGLNYQVTDILVSELTGTEITVVALNYYVKPLTGFVTSGADRWAGAAKNCQQPPHQTSLTGYDYAALIAYNKYLNQSGNTPGTAFLWYYSIKLYSSTGWGYGALYIPDNELFGEKDAPFPNHRWTSNGSFPVYPEFNRCVYANEMDTYRDQIHDQVTSLGAPSILDIEWEDENSGSVPRRGRWVYKQVLVGVAEKTPSTGG